MMNKASILIPCYNSVSFIAETLDSVLAQTYTNWECIIVDDHSTDNSVAIIKTYCQRYLEKFKLYTNPRKGACAARNYAFELSVGDYIQYLDSDDLLSENKIEEQIKLFEQYGNDVIGSCQWGRFYGNKESVIWERQYIDRDYDNPVDWLVDSWTDNGMAANSCWLTPRKLIEQAGKWDESLQINQDGDFFAKVLINAKAIKFSENGIIYYRSNLSESVTQKDKKSRVKAESLLKSYKNYEQILLVQDTYTVRKALGNNYLNFAYQFDALYPDLSREALLYFAQLGLNKMCPVGGIWFKRVSKIIGFKNSLMIKRIFSI